MADGSIESFEAKYLGEPAPRSPLVAALLTFISPGLPWAYLGQVPTAVAINLLAVALWGVFAAFWTRLEFFPGLPFSVFFVGWLFLISMLALDAWLIARRRGERYVLRDSNHPIIYTLVAVFSFLMPLYGVFHMASRVLWSFQTVEDDAMYPTLLAGDALLVARFRSDEEPLQGEIVAYEDPQHEGLRRFGRVIGPPGSTVAFAAGIFYVNDSPLPQGSLNEVAMDELESMSGTFEDGMRPVVEETADVIYVVSLPESVYWGEPMTWELGENEIFVLNDQRGDLEDSRTFGPVSLEAVTGRPVYVAWSLSSEEQESLSSIPSFMRSPALLLGTMGSDTPHRNERLGRHVQPPALTRGPVFRPIEQGEDGADNDSESEPNEAGDD